MISVLVVCTGNSCRSVLGEALFNHLGQSRIKAYSAGSHPLGRINPGAIQTLRRHGLPTEDYQSQSWDEYADLSPDIVITVCDNAAGETCPLYMTQAVRAHWGVADPGHVQGSEQEKIAAFENTYAILQRRINKMLALPLEQMSSDELTTALNAIGQDVE